MTELFDLSKIVAAIAAELNVSVEQVHSAVQLLEDGNTLPFIARYRKEATRGLDELQLRKIQDALAKAHELADRRKTILKTIEESGQLTPALKQQILDCDDKQRLEDIYLPFKPKRKTRASAAREKGLQPLADLLLAQRRLNEPVGQLLQRFVSADKGVTNADEALAGACDIVAEVWSEKPDLRQWMHERAARGRMTSTVKRGKKEAGGSFETYFDHNERIDRMPSHRFLAMKRGESEGVLRLAIELDEDYVLPRLQSRLIQNTNFEFADALQNTVVDCYKRLLQPAAESAMLQQLKAKADEEAIAVFASNVRELLLAAPAGPHVTIGIDPGFRTGCKVAVVDRTGRFLENATIFPTPPRSDTAGAASTLLSLIQKYDATMIAIGNGTASRETDAFVAGVLKDNDLQITKVVVSEAGASVYSASELAAKEFPDLDLTVRGAISIAHRLQDPLAELVKIDPKAVGVGQYQHDVNQNQLQRSLDREVESCVSSVGVDVNMASAPLLSYVPGIGPAVAKNIVKRRDESGAFRSRSELLKVPKLGAKAFEQCAGFLRIRDGKEPLDNSAVHPESYPVVADMARKLNVTASDLVGNATLVSQLQADQSLKDTLGQFTVKDLLTELARPGRDPRAEFKAVSFAEGVEEISDLAIGMKLEGVVTNVTHFGAFVDIGVHQDGLIHISQLADHFVKDPAQEVSVGDIVHVTVMEIDAPRKRISLSRKRDA
ncbi:Tex family protein [Fuerstiella marisgermanici]|uniref:30S ribosomal protein S1 n=1 Tax=Fuerstiella marisgermanici TaxID=1891926 RepID=A0A1P8WBH1_9PLAN|nr:Tex family protein [Fuerstiella marisgermanici]APZ91408.1 30S ribosomal protein S1 [Fuerstiella marisgermanici]